MSDIISGVEGIASLIPTIAKGLTDAIAAIDPSELDKFFASQGNVNGVNGQAVRTQIASGLANFDRDFGRLIVQPLIEGSMGVDYATLQNDSANALNTIEGAVGFSLVLRAVVEAIDVVIKTVMGDRAPEFVLDSIRQIPEAIGLNYFLGLTMSNLFEVAVGTPLEEAINQQVLPSRVDIQIIRQALRQHRITAEQADAYRTRLGFPEDQWQMILELGSNALSTSDIQTAYEYGWMSDSDITTYLQGQGYTDDDIALLKNIYIKAAESTGGQVYRQVARTAYLDNVISAADFTKILQQIQLPPESITLELTALDLQKEIGVKQLSAADIKTAYESGDITVDEVKTRLTNEGFNADDVALILSNWQIGPYAVTGKTTAKTIMRYYYGGLITKEQAETDLTRIGIDADTQAAIFANKGLLGSAYAHTVTSATILSAFKDEVIGVDQARTDLEAIGVEPNSIDQMLALAEYQLAHKKPPKSTTKALSVTDIKDAFDDALVTDTWAIREMVNLGYSETDAELLMAIWVTKNTGTPPIGWVVLN